MTKFKKEVEILNIQELQEQREAKRTEALELLSTDLDKAAELRDEIKEIDSQIEALTKEEQLKKDLEEIVTEPTEETEEVVEEETEQKQETTEEVGQGDEVMTETEVRSKKQNPIVDVPGDLKEEKRNKEREDFRHYLISGEKRALTTESTEIIVPEDIKTEVLDLRVNDLTSLDQLVTVKKVSTGRGTQPVLATENDGKPLEIVEELAENPELALVPFTDIDFNIKTRRGYVKISREALDDAIGAEQMIVDLLNQKEVNTRNHLILEALKGLTEKSVTNADALKTLINTGVPGKFKKSIVMSQTAYNSIDLLKDGNGRYLFQDAITSASGKTLLGLPVYVFDDALIGKDTMYIGDMKSAVVLFDRSQYRAKWTDYMHYGECLMIAVRLDCKLINKNAVVKVKFGGTPTV